MAPLAQEFEFLRKTGRPASFGQPEGRYPFFTSSQEISKWTDVPDCEGPALVFGTGGSASLHYVEGPFSATNDCYVVKPKSGKTEDAKFFYYFLRKNIHVLENGFRGAGLKHISKKYLEEIKLPVGRKIDRKKVVSILDKANAIRRKREQMLVMADDAILSTFLGFFGDPAHNPKGWQKFTLGELGVVQGGLQVSKKRDELPLRKPYLRVANVFRDKLDLQEIKAIGLTESEFERIRLREGDILIVEGHGNPDEIGRASVWDGSITECVHQNHLIRFRANTSLVLPEYISRLLNSKGGRRQLIAAGRTTSGLNTISTKKVKEVVVPVPPIEVQQQFADAIQKFGELVSIIELGNSEADDFFLSLSQRAFRGEL